MSLKKITHVERENICGGACECNCNHNLDDSNSDYIYVGSAKTLEECSNVCLANGWKIESCAAKKSKKKESE